MCKKRDKNTFIALFLLKNQNVLEYKKYQLRYLIGVKTIARFQDIKMFSLCQELLGVNKVYLFTKIKSNKKRTFI